MAVWDETPHMLAMALLPLAVVFLALAIQKGTLFRYAGAVATIVAMTLASTFGPIEAAMVSIFLLRVADQRWIKHKIMLIGTLGICAYAMSAFSLPPSLISAVHAASVHGERQAWSLASLTALAIAVFGWIVLWQSLRKWSQNRWFQFTVLFAYMASYPPLIETYFHRELLPQPDRYKIEMEAGLALVAVFGLWPLVRKLPRSIGFGLLFLLLSLGAERVVSLRRFAKAILSSVDIKQTIEYRAAVWTQENLRGVRVMMPGSIAQWTNAFTDVQQFSGSS
jgi:hypothetical protein